MGMNNMSNVMQFSNRVDSAKALQLEPFTQKLMKCEDLWDFTAVYPGLNNAYNNAYNKRHKANKRKLVV